MSILALNKVNYSYTNGKKILNNISMEFEKGKFYTILGVSGSGKTTLLSLLAGLDEPQSGKILYNNQDIREKGYENHRKNNVSLIFQNYNLIDYMTPLENLKIVNPKADKTILNELGLKDDEIKRNVLKLSGGQQQRLCIARALALKPKVLLMDEPTSALDPIATNRIEELLLDLKNEFTILIVTHNMSQAARISDYSMFMYLGNLVEYDETQKMFTNPSDKRTEEYLTGQFG